MYGMRNYVIRDGKRVKKICNLPELWFSKFSLWFLHYFSFYITRSFEILIYSDVVLSVFINSQKLPYNNAFYVR
jgi:hypothetical protein